MSLSDVASIKGNALETPKAHIQKKVPHKTFCSIFTRAKHIIMKFCQCVASLYAHKVANFGWFIL